MRTRQVCLMILISLIPLHAPLPAASEEPGLPRALSLTAALEFAMRQNPGLQADAALRSMARGDTTAAATLANPLFLFRSEDFNGGSLIDRHTLFLEFKQEIETGGKRSRRTAAAEANQRAIEANVENAARLLRFGVQEAYYQVVFAKAELEAAREVLTDFDRVVRFNEDRFRAGEVSGGDLRRVQVDRFRRYNDLVSAELSLKQAKASLLTLLGVTDLTVEFDVTEDLGKPQVAAALPSLRAEAVRARPDLKAQHHRILRAREQLNLERASRFPNLSPFVGYKRDFGQDAVVFGVEIPLPLFNRNQGGILRATAEAERESFQRQRIEAQVLLELDQAFNRFEAERQRLEALELDYLPKARESREIADRAYQLGTMDLDVFLDVQGAFRDLRRLYHRSLYDLNIARLQVEAAIGR